MASRHTISYPKAKKATSSGNKADNHKQQSSTSVNKDSNGNKE